MSIPNSLQHDIDDKAHDSTTKYCASKPPKRLHHVLHFLARPDSSLAICVESGRWHDIYYERPNTSSVITKPSRPTDQLHPYRSRGLAAHGHSIALVLTDNALFTMSLSISTMEDIVTAFPVGGKSVEGFYRNMLTRPDGFLYERCHRVLVATLRVAQCLNDINRDINRFTMPTRLDSHHGPTYKDRTQIYTKQ